LGNTKLAWDDLAGGGCLPETLKQVEQSVWRGSALAKRLAALGSSHLPKRKDVELNEAIKKALPLVRASLPSNITLHTDLDSGSFSLIGDSDQIEHVVLNLCSNAVLSMNAQGGLLTIKTEMSSVDADNTNNLGPGNYLRLSICDTGTGMEPETLKRIFEPFFTTRAEGAGSGLGLYVVKNIVDKLNGRVVVNSSAGKGTTVDVYVPLAKSTTRQKNVPNIAEHPQRSQGEASYTLMMTKRWWSSSPALLSDWATM